MCGKAHTSSQQPHPYGNQQRCRQGFEQLDRLGTAQHHPQVQRPEQHEPDHLTRAAQALPALEQRAKQQVDGQATEQGLDAEPAAGHHRPNQARHVGAEDAERRTQQHRKRNAVLGSGKRIERQRNQHDEVGQQDCQQRLANAQTEIGRQHPTQGVGRDADGHADPQGGDVPFVPGALVHLGRCDVVVITGAVEYIATGCQFVQPVMFDHLRSALLHGAFSRIVLVIRSSADSMAGVNTSPVLHLRSGLAVGPQSRCVPNRRGHHARPLPTGGNSLICKALIDDARRHRGYRVLSIRSSRAGPGPCTGITLVQPGFFRCGSHRLARFQTADFAWKILTRFRSCQVRQNGENVTQIGDLCFLLLFFKKLSTE